MSKNQSFLTRLGFALGGIAHSLRSERSMRVHVGALALVAIVMIVLAPPPQWWAMVALACGAVLATELINTSLEHLADLLHPDEHPSIRIVKDCAAAAVLVASVAAAAVGVALAVHVWRGI